MQVLILSPKPPPRGVLQSLVALGVAPVVAQPGGESETEGLVRYERVASRGDPANPLDLRWSRKALRTLVRDLRPDLVHISGDPWTPTAESGAAQARSLGIPYVVVGHASLGGPKGVTAKWQAKRVRDGASGLAGTSRPALDHLSADASEGARGVIPDPGFEIPGSVDPRDDPPFPTIGVFGRVVPERGLDLLLDALSDVFGEWRLRIIGTGPEQESLEAQAQRLGLSARIEWLGGLPRQELASQWRQIDVIVAPSRSTDTWVEPTGSIVLEAMAHSVAAVVSRCGALPHVVGEGGLVVDEDDRPALARAIQGLVEDPARTRVLGASARGRVLEAFGHRAIADQMVTLWKAALAPQKSS